MRVLVTGGSGFIGGAVARFLAQRHEVLAPRHRELDLLDAAAVETFLRERKPDVVVHSAVSGGETALDAILRMQANLVRHQGLYGRLVYFGSGAEFAKTRDLKKVRDDEFGRELPRDPYGLGKYHCTLEARARSNILNLRLFGVYGPGENHRVKFISNSVAKTLLGLDLDIRQDVRFDYLWIDDFPPIVEHFLTAPFESADMNVTPDASIRLSEIVATIERLAGRPVRASFTTPGLNFEYTGDNARLRQAMPQVAFTSYEDGIRRLWEHYRDAPHLIDAEAVRRDDYARRCVVRPASGT